MNILFLSLVFSDRKHVHFYEEQLEVFVRNGHKVFVACSNDSRSIEPDGIQEWNGMTVLRIKTGNVTGTTNIIKKGLATVSVDYYFKKAIKKNFKNERFYLILYPTPPITLANTIAWAKKYYGAKTYLMLKDIFPQNAVDLGMMTTNGLKGLIHSYFRKKEKFFYSVSDTIGCMSPANVKYVLEHNPEISPNKVEVCPNCLSVPAEEPTFIRDSSNLKKQYGIPEDAVVFIYGGNLGKPQGIGFLIECLRYVKDNKKAFFMIIGEGSEFGKLQQFIDEEKPSNVKLLHYMPKEEYQQVSDQCDVGLMFLDHRFTIPNFPSRILNYLASGNPVLAATDPNSDIGTIARDNGFGFCCESNDVKGFEKAVNDFISADREQMGKKGWEFFKNNWAVENGYKIIMNHFGNN